MSGEPHVRDELRKKVMEAAEALGYRPNLAARQLKANRSFLIVHMFARPSASFTEALHTAAAVETRARNYHLVSEPIDLDGKEAEAVVHAVKRLQAEGVLLSPPLSDKPAVLAALAKLNLRIACVAGTPAEFGTVLSIDDREVSRDLVAHLVALGHRRIAFVTPRATHIGASRRERGYRDALEERGIEIDDDLIVRGDFSFVSGYKAAVGLFALENRPTAVFAANDESALGVMSAARANGLAISAELAVAGFDDSRSGRMAYPPLTTVRQPIQQFAERAVRYLIEKDATVDVSDVRHELLVRGSTDGTAALVDDHGDSWRPDDV